MKRFSELVLLTAVLLASAFTMQIKAQEKASKEFPRDSIINAAREIISHVKYCALITTDSTGTANVRTMNPFPPEDDMTVWMATNKHTRKYAEIIKNPNVTLYYANHAAVEGYVTIKGKAVLVDDMAVKLKMKRDYWTQAFPDFNDLILVKIIPERLEVINYKHRMNNSSTTWLAPHVVFDKK